MSSSIHANNKTKNVLVLGQGITQGLDDTTLTAEGSYLTNFSRSRRKFCLTRHYNGSDSYLFVNGAEIIKFKVKDSEIEIYTLCLRNVSVDFPDTNMIETGLNGSVSCDAIDISDIIKIHKYLMKNHAIV